MNNLFLLEGFSNYFNKQVKRFEFLNDYLFKCKKYETMRSINFIVGDGINTSQILQTNIKIHPDYLIVTNADEEIVSRWFVLQNDNLRNGQSRLTLKRDVIAEKLDEVLDSDMLIERANVDSSNPLFFVSENENFNQIKQSETLLKDETGINWIVGYIARDTNVTEKITSIVEQNKKYDQIEGLNVHWNDETDFTKGGFIDTALEVSIDTEFIRKRGGRFYNVIVKLNGLSLGNTKNLNCYGKQFGGNGHISYVPDEADNQEISSAFRTAYDLSKKQLSTTLITAFNSLGIELIDQNDLGEFVNDKIFYSLAKQKYYKLKVGTAISQNKKLILPETQIPSVTQILNEISKGTLTNLGTGSSWSIFKNPYSVDLIYLRRIISFEEVQIEGVLETQISNSRQHLIDAPFDMFAVPYSENNYNLVQQINLKLGQSVYDIQLLPYCPVRNLISPEGINLTLGTKDADYSEIIDSSNKKAVSFILRASKSSDSFKIKNKISIPTDLMDLKVYSETTFIRIVSPNYNGVFEFNAAKNDGIDYFEVNFTYKPYSPYIHLNPNFKGLYGKDFNDSRGLICNGDFSIAMTSDAWRQYEISNKNYQNIFNTEIKAMDESQRLSMISKGISSALGGIGTGLVAGLFTGNPFVGLGAGLLSSGAGAVDLGISQDMFENSRQAKIDSFNLNLGNIKARPDSLTKVSAHTVNNKYFPFVEIYSSTEEEKIVLKNKLKLTGMNLNFVGKINDIKNSINFSFVKGTVLRINLNEDSHFAQEINNRMQGGVYL